MCLPAIKFWLLAFIMLPFALSAQDAKTLEQNFNLVFKNLQLSERKELVDRSVETWLSLPQAERDSVEESFSQVAGIESDGEPGIEKLFEMCQCFSYPG